VGVEAVLPIVLGAVSRLIRHKKPVGVASKVLLLTKTAKSFKKSKTSPSSAVRSNPAEEEKHKAATVIQAQGRGYLARKRHKKASSIGAYKPVKTNFTAPDIEAEMELPDYEQFDDYLEMVIQFGYVTLFASAFPTAAALSVFCNLIEMKSDLFKLIWVYKRPPAHRAANIGTWQNVILCMALLSILTNCMIFAFSSEQMMQWLPFMFKPHDEAEGHHAGDNEFLPEWARAGHSMCFALEHLILAIWMAIFFLIPSEPEWVTTKLKKLKYNKEKLANEARQSRREQRAKKLWCLTRSLTPKHKSETAAVMPMEEKIVASSECSGTESILRQRKKKVSGTGVSKVLQALSLS